MRFGGHETFSIREGWLFKGLRLLREDPDALYDENVADRLGVGRNMAKSIRYWLLATELADPVKNETGRKTIGLKISDFGQLIWDNDRFLLERDSWWLLHINLVTNSFAAAAWSWFFSAFRRRRFDRGVALESFRRHLEVREKRVPSIKTLRRDLACLLSSYAQVHPSELVDPEDATECPLRQLGLLRHFRDSGMYQMNLGRKPIAPTVFGYAMAKAWETSDSRTGSLEVTFLEASQREFGPCAVFGLTLEELVETVMGLEEGIEDSAIRVAGLAGERTIRVRQASPLGWASELYRAREGAHHAA